MPPATEQMLRLEDAQVSRLTRQVQEHRDEALQARGDFPVRHADRYRRFLADPSLRPPGPWPESARLFMPITRSIIERLHGELWQGTVANLLAIQATPFG